MNARGVGKDERARGMHGAHAKVGEDERARGATFTLRSARMSARGMHGAHAKVGEDERR